jgi:hypothetical protein
MALITYLYLRFLELLRPKRRRNGFYGVRIQQSVDESVYQPNAYELRLIRGGDYDKWLKFKCPNRCGTLISLNLNHARSPFWSVTLHQDNTMSVSPSVVHNSCGAHFFIRRNKIDWV